MHNTNYFKTGDNYRPLFMKRYGILLGFIEAGGPPCIFKKPRVKATLPCVIFAYLK